MDYLVKWNPRGVDLKPWIDKANELDDWETLREGKRVAIFSESVGEEYGDNSYNDSAIISLYKQHATAEQFHSELRPLRVPSGGLGQGLAPRFLATRESRG